MGWVGAFYGTSIGKKIVVAITGAIMVLFLIGHMFGNLQVFEGRGPTVEETQLNEYAELLRTEMGLLWALRILLVVTLVLHVVTTVVLYFENRAARPAGYALRSYREASVYSRTMIFGGIALFAYVVYHILHLTAGTAHPGVFTPHDVYSNVVRSFQDPWIAGAYFIATIALYFHLAHAVLSLFQTLGVHHPRHVEAVRKAARWLSLIICVGFVSVPVSILLGWVK